MAVGFGGLVDGSQLRARARRAIVPATASPQTSTSCRSTPRCDFVSVRGKTVES